MAEDAKVNGEAQLDPKIEEQIKRRLEYIKHINDLVVVATEPPFSIRPATDSEGKTILDKDNQVKFEKTYPKGYDPITNIGKLKLELLMNLIDYDGHLCEILFHDKNRHMLNEIIESPLSDFIIPFGWKTFLLKMGLK
ncbi:MAG: hypothetical protein ACYC2U_04665 [Candidatus Amoebophilus sp.]